MGWNARCPEEARGGTSDAVPRGPGESCQVEDMGRGTEKSEGVVSEGAARDLCFVKRLALALLDFLPK